MRKILLLLTVAGMGLTLGVGCSSDSSTSSTSAGSSSSGAPVALSGTVNDKGTGDATSGKLNVLLNDFSFAPTFIKVNPGQQVTLHLSNEGKATHTFTSAALGVDQTLAPGKEIDLNITAPGSGAAQFHCTFHESSGMQGATFEKVGDTIPGAAPASASSSSSSSSSYTYN